MAAQKRNGCFRIIALLLILSFLRASAILSASAADKNDRDKEKGKGKTADSEAGAMYFPVKGNIDFKQGTYEVWFAIDYSFSQNLILETSSVHLVSLFNIVDKKGGPLHKPDGMRLILRMVQNRDSHNIVFDSNNCGNMVKGQFETNEIKVKQPRVDLKKGEWHYFTCTWEKKENSMYQLMLHLDGELIGKRDGMTNGEVDMARNDENLITMGGLCTVDSFRISRKVRTDDEIKQSFSNGLKFDEDTLMLKDGKDFSKLRSEKNLKNNVSSKGDLVGCGKMVKGKFGEAIKLNDRK